MIPGGTSTPTPSRRSFLRAMTAAAGGALAGGVLGRTLARRLADEGPLPTGALDVVSMRPLDLATPEIDLALPFTPNDLFFVRSHHGPPPLARAGWSLQIDGLADRPLRLSLAELRSFEPVTLPAVLQCSGNGRAFFSPRVPGAQWRRGAVGQARWTGARLADILARAGAGTGGPARHVTLRGADEPPLSTTPRFVRSIPLARALDPSTLVAYAMNGEPLPHLHGAPARLVVPGWVGDDWVKWLQRVTLTDQEDSGFYMATAYRLPAPGGTGTEAMTEMPVKSVVARPLDGATVGVGRHEATGVAFSGGARIERVELSLDEGRSWTRAELDGPDAPGAWRVWRGSWTARAPGALTLWARATDARGGTQPARTPWNRSGYLWNAVDAVRVEVAA